MELNNNTEEIIKLKELISKCEIELIMSGYHDGWVVKWLNNKKITLDNKLNNIIKGKE